VSLPLFVACSCASLEKSDEVFPLVFLAYMWACSLRSLPLSSALARDLPLSSKS